jgi:hypothetical protein
MGRMWRILVCMKKTSFDNPKPDINHVTRPMSAMTWDSGPFDHYFGHLPCGWDRLPLRVEASELQPPFIPVS